MAPARTGVRGDCEDEGSNKIYCFSYVFLVN